MRKVKEFLTTRVEIDAPRWVWILDLLTSITLCVLILVK